ncbi:MAG: exonuclease SbcCD subunit D [Candidatus Thermoplasmatota archaeon]|nr:exonuclease SbcCD subunit D [Candidatus Thermoplasmatota archaeon]
MRLLHVSDLHLGKSIHGQDLEADQRHALSQIEKEAKRGCGALIIAGDVFDRAIPPTYAIEMLSGFLERVSDAGVEIVMIPGNHDSPERLGFASGILSRKGVHIRSSYHDCGSPIFIEDGDERVQIFTLPFVEEAIVREFFPDEAIDDHSSAVGFLVDRMRDGIVDGIPSVLVAHEYTGGDVIRSESERELLLGNQGRVPSEVFGGFDYVALGHLHGPQVASREMNARYSGSILPYSFSEAEQEKSMIELNIKNGVINFGRVVIEPLRRMSVIEDSFENILSNTTYRRYADDYLSIRLTDTGLSFDIQNRLRAIFPYLMDIQMPNLIREGAIDPEIMRRALDSPRELFSLFLERFGWEGEKREMAFEVFDSARKIIQRRQRGDIQ